MAELKNRRKYTATTVREIQAELADAKELAEGKACIYATGSFGRGEAKKGSDLDLFIVGRGTESEAKRSELSRLDEICIKANLVHATRKLDIPDFDGDGKYLSHHTAARLTETLGKPDDDALNTFTARLLLLLESSPLVGQKIYDEAIELVVRSYWKDFDDHKIDFIPAFLANDILRLWRTFCVNYEARTQTQTTELKIKRRVKNFKLKYSRLLTCYSALLFLLHVFTRKNTVTPSDAIDMTKFTPTERLEHIARQTADAQHSVMTDLLNKYETFLERTSISDEQLSERFREKEVFRQYIEDAHEFSALMFDAVTTIGNGNRFHRMIVV